MLNRRLNLVSLGVFAALFTYLMYSMLLPVIGALFFGFVLAMVTFGFYRSVQELFARFYIPVPITCRSTRLGEVAPQFTRRLAQLLSKWTDLLGAPANVREVGTHSATTRLVHWIESITFKVPRREWRSIYPFAAQWIPALFTTVVVTAVLVLPVLVLTSAISLKGLYVLQQLTNPSSPEFVTLQAGVTAAFNSAVMQLPDPVRIAVQEQFAGISFLSAGTGQFASFIMGVLFAAYNGLLDIIIGTIVVMFAMYYGYVDGVRLLRYIQSRSPMDDAHEEYFFQKFAGMARAIINGTLIIGVAQGILDGFVLYVAGVEMWFLLTLLMIVMSVIPVLGASIVMVAVAGYLVFTGQVATGVTVFAIGMFVGTVDNFIRPHLVKRSVSMPSSLILLSSLTGILVFGPIGFITGPVIYALGITALDIWVFELDLLHKEEVHARAVAERSERRSRWVRPMRSNALTLNR